VLVHDMGPNVSHCLPSSELIRVIRDNELKGRSWL
jgi:hypothetical protein